MKISRIDHLGIGVESIDAVLPYFENVLGLKCYAIEEVPYQKVKTAFLKVGEVKLELLEPTSPESAVAKWLEKGGKGVHHVAFAVEDGVAEALVEAEGKEIRLSHKNPDIIKLYEEYLGEPLGERSEQLLHTHYFNKQIQ